MKKLFLFMFILFCTGITIGQTCPVTHLYGTSTFTVEWAEEHEDWSGIGQTFTACADGTVTAITVGSATFSCSSGNVRITVGSGTPISGTNITTQTHSLNCGSSTQTFNLSPTLSLDEGSGYYFTIEGIEDEGRFRVYYNGSGSYDGGSRYHRGAGGSWGNWSGADLNFELTGTAALPVELISIDAIRNKGIIELIWRTASELNNEGFELEHSLDGRNWERIDFIPGHGTTFEKQTYSYIDEKPMLGTNYYRLRQVDFDGQFEYSDIVSIAFRGDDTVKDVVIYPNPVQHGSLGVYLPVEEATLQLYDAVGKLVQQQEVSGTTATINTENVAAGIYWLEVISAGERWVEKVVVE